MSSEHELIRRAQEGDEIAFVQLMKPYKKLMLYTILMMLNNPDDADDVFQEVMIKVWMHLPEFKFSGKFKNWLMSIVVNTTINYRHARTRRWEGETAAQEYEPQGTFMAQEDQTPEERIEFDELLRALDDALPKLSEKHRTVIVLYAIEGMSYEDIAETLGIDVGTVMSRLHYARKKLKTLLKKVRK